jgi:hypothetical protein
MGDSILKGKGEWVWKSVRYQACDLSAKQGSGFSPSKGITSSPEWLDIESRKY